VPAVVIFGTAMPASLMRDLHVAEPVVRRARQSAAFGLGHSGLEMAFVALESREAEALRLAD